MKRIKCVLTALLLALTGNLGLSMAETETTGGVKVSGTVKITNAGDAMVSEGMVYLLDANGAVAHSSETSVSTEGGKPTSVYSIENVTSGNYTLLFEGKCVISNQPKAISYTEQNVAVGSTNLTKDITATVETERDWMEIKVKYDADFYSTGTPGYQSTPIANAEVTCAQVGGTTKKVKTNYTGIASFLVSKSGEYNITVKAASYADTTFKIGYKAMQEVYLKKKPVVLVKLTGNVTMGGEAVPATIGFKIGLRADDGVSYQASLTVGGKYTFTQVPAGEGTLYLHDEQGDHQYNSCKYVIKTPAEGSITIPSSVGSAGHTQNIEVEKIAEEVSGTIKGFTSGLGGEAKMTLTKTGEQTPAYEVSVNREAGMGSYKFPGVRPGTYTVQFACTGYAIKGNATIAPVTVTLEEAQTVPEFEVEIVPFTATFEGSAAVYNPVTKRDEPLSGAKLELWSYNRAAYVAIEKLKDDITADANGGFSFTHEMKLGDAYCIKITHASTKPNEATGIVSAGTVTVHFPTFRLASSTTPEPLPMKDFSVAWNPTNDSLSLSWTWPEALNSASYRITNLKLERLMNGSETPITLTHWEQTAGGFAFDALPKSYKDTLQTNDETCTYIFTITYELPEGKDLKVTFPADLKKGPSYRLTCSVDDPEKGYIVLGNGTNPYTGGPIGQGATVKLTAKPKAGYQFKAWVVGTAAVRDTMSFMAEISFSMTQDTTLTALFCERGGVFYTLALSVNNPDYGEVSGGGEFDENAQVTAKATAKAGYRFKEWQENGVAVANAGAEYTFTLTKNRSLMAIFERGESQANEELEAALWSVYAEGDGVLVINGQTGDQYMVYDLSGRLSARAANTGSEVRMPLKKNQLYMVRRIAVSGQIDVKKIVLR